MDGKVSLKRAVLITVLILATMVLTYMLKHVPYKDTTVKSSTTTLGEEQTNRKGTSSASSTEIFIPKNTYEFTASNNSTTAYTTAYNYTSKYSYTTGKSYYYFKSTTKEITTDPFNASDFSNPEDFYDYYYDDFIDYYEAEDYYYEHTD